jgi:hypothetical protein
MCTLKFSQFPAVQHSRANRTGMLLRTRYKVEGSWVRQHCIANSALISLGDYNDSASFSITASKVSAEASFFLIRRFLWF